MVDIYLEGAEVHAEAPEEEQEAALILNAVLSGKTTPAGMDASVRIKGTPQSAKASRCGSAMVRVWPLRLPWT